MPERGLWATGDDWWGIKVGYELDGTFSKRIKIKKRKSSIKDLFDQYQSLKQFGVLTFNIIDRFEVYGLLGAMKIDMAQRPVRNIRVEYETDSQLIWGVGGRVVLVYWEEVIMGINARYNASHLKIDRLIVNAIPQNPKSTNMHYHEWQVGGSFSREIGNMIPYIGLAYASQHSYLRSIPNTSVYSFRDEKIKNRNPFVLLFGLGMTSGQAVNFNIETRLVGEMALTGSADLRF
jgi:major outer membrane protein